MKSLVITCLVVVFCAACAPAQPSQGGEGRPFERIEQWKKIRLGEVLDLKEEQSVRFFARLNEHEGRRRDLFKERGDVLDRIERLVRNHGDETEIQKEMDNVSTVDGKMMEEGKKFLGSLGDILTVEQRAKLLLFERRFEKELREAMREAQRRRHGADNQP